MCKMRNRITGIFSSYFCVLLFLGLSNSLDIAEEPQRIERAILGGSSGSQDIVGGGAAGKDFPALNAIPRSDFPCGGLTPGYYADEEYGCQVFHICQADRGKDTFLCPNGTIFDQQKLVCDWWFNVDCSTSRLHVSVNDEIGKVPPSRSSKQPPAPPKTSFTSVSGFTQSQGHTKSSISTTQSTIEATQTPDRFAGGSFGIPLDTFSNLGEQNVGRNLDEVQDVRVNTRPATQRQRPRQPSVSGTPERGISLQSVTNNLDSSRRTSFHSSRNQIRDKVSSVSGVPLSTISERERTTSIQNIPDHFTVPKPPKPSLNTERRGSTGRVSNARRVTVNKRPLGAVDISTTSLRDSTPLTIPQAVRPTSRPRSRTPARQNVITRDQQIRTFDIAGQDIAILDDEKVSTQFFNIGKPRVVSNRRPSSRGRPLPVNNLQPGGRTVADVNNALRNSVGRPLVLTNTNDEARNTGGRVLPTANVQPDLSRGQIGRPLPSTNVQPGLSRSQIGRPLPSTNVQPGFTGNQIGRPLSSTNVQPGSSRSQIGRPLPSTNVQPGLTRNQIGRPLSSTNVQPGLTRNQIGRPLSSTNVQPGLSRSQIGRPLPSANVQPGLTRNQIGRPLPPTNIQTNSIVNTPRRNNNVVRNQQPRVTVNRGSARFRTSERGRARINRLINSRNRSPRIQVITRPVTTRVTQPFVFSRDFDDDDLDDINDPFDDDRFDLDDRFDDDRFDLDDRFDDDRFDKPDLDDIFDDDRFDLDDRFDDDRFDRPDLDDRFDDDRFDLDDRFDDDRFDKPDLDDRFDDDRFDLDDRFDDDRFDKPDLDDRFDDDRFDFDDRFDDDPFDDDDRFDLDDRFDFDDEIFDDRRERFDNDANFNFVRSARGSTFTDADDTKPSEGKEPKIAIEPPSEIQLPPPPR